MSKKTQSKGSGKADVLHDVMSTIDAGEAKMKPGWYFVVVSAVLLVSTVLVVVTLSVLLSTIWNDIDVARTARVLEFGSPGRAFILRNTPWLLMVAAVFMISTLYYLVNKFEMSYRHRHAAPALVLCGMLFSGLVLSFSGINQKISDNTLSRFQTIGGALENGYLVGEILEIGEDYTTVRTEEGDLKVKTPSGPRLRGKLPNLFQEGKELKIFGKYVDGEFEAYGITLPSLNNRVKGVQSR